jgi:hypothetical protein
MFAVALFTLGQIMDSTYMPIKRIMATENVVFMPNGVSFGHKEG